MGRFVGLHRILRGGRTDPLYEVIGPRTRKIVLIGWLAQFWALFDYPASTYYVAGLRQTDKHR